MVNFVPAVASDLACTIHATWCPPSAEPCNVGAVRNEMGEEGKEGPRKRATPSPLFLLARSTIVAFKSQSSSEKCQVAKKSCVNGAHRSSFEQPLTPPFALHRCPLSGCELTRATVELKWRNQFKIPLGGLPPLSLRSHSTSNTEPVQPREPCFLQSQFFKLPSSLLLAQLPCHSLPSSLVQRSA